LGLFGELFLNLLSFRCLWHERRIQQVGPIFDNIQRPSYIRVCNQGWHVQPHAYRQGTIEIQKHPQPFFEIPFFSNRRNLGEYLLWGIQCHAICPSCLKGCTDLFHPNSRISSMQQIHIARLDSWPHLCNEAAYLVTSSRLSRMCAF